MSSGNENRKKENYQRVLDQVIAGHQDRKEVPTLFLHSCCAPCSSYVLEYLAKYFAVTIFYYNPNIYPEEEYRKRVKEQQYLIGAMDHKHPVQFQEGTYHPEAFFAMARGMEQLPERGERCYHCYQMRLEETARMAAQAGYDYFCTTLSISPLKDAQWLNEIGQKLEQKYAVKWLPSDFKKKEGYKRSIALSEAYGLYRQNYCGCVYSKRERENA